MQARLQRGRILQSQQLDAKALSDLDDVIQSPVNFYGTVPEALVVRGKVHIHSGEREKALEDFMAALAQDDADGVTVAEAYLGCGEVLASLGHLSEAKTAFLAARDHPDGEERVKSEAEDMLSSLGNG